ncbi:MAG: cell division protein SepF [Corynebacterium sp.]|nr:cell division protein SepF [Corynebacterium sp.]
MTAIQKAKEFFGFVPLEEEPYYDESGAYERPYARAERTTERESSYSDSPYRRRDYAATIVPVTISSYKDAARIGEPYRDGDAVVFNMSSMSKDDAKRLIDFSAGLVFVTRGKMEKLSSRVFAVIPENARVSRSELEQAAGL